MGRPFPNFPPIWKALIICVKLTFRDYIIPSSGRKYFYWITVRTIEGKTGQLFGSERAKSSWTQTVNIFNFDPKMKQEGTNLKIRISKLTSFQPSYKSCLFYFIPLQPIFYFFHIHKNPLIKFKFVLLLMAPNSTFLELWKFQQVLPALFYLIFMMDRIVKKISTL
jgi:hypothetical protein